MLCTVRHCACFRHGMITLLFWHRIFSTIYASIHIIIPLPRRVCSAQYDPLCVCFAHHRHWGCVFGTPTMYILHMFGHNNDCSNVRSLRTAWSIPCPAKTIKCLKKERQNVVYIEWHRFGEEPSRWSETRDASAVQLIAFRSLLRRQHLAFPSKICYCSLVLCVKWQRNTVEGFPVYDLKFLFSFWW